jgi:hypothetical protein
MFFESINVAAAIRCSRRSIELDGAPLENGWIRGRKNARRRRGMDMPAA